MTDRETLIEEAAKAIDSWLFIYDSNPHTPRIPLAKSIWAVFEKALGEAPVTPTVAEGTSDEREALKVVEAAKSAYLEAYPGDDHTKRFAALDRLAARFRRSEPQGEPPDAPSDADLDAARAEIAARMNYKVGPTRDAMRAALRAARGVR